MTHSIRCTQSLLCFAFCLFFNLQINAQDYATDYTPLEIAAPIPESILTKSYQKSQAEIEARDSGNERRKAREAKDGFILQTNFILDKLLDSPQLLFNTPLNAAVEKVAEKLLRNRPELYQSATFYIIKSSATNAFATDRGDVFITMGLLARLETEAELAFILAHEMIHTDEKHSMQSFDRRWEISENRAFRNQGSVAMLTEQSNFSKEKEIEADNKGLNLMAATVYDLKNITSAFRKLEYGHAPIFRDTLQREFFELPELIIRDELWTDKTVDITALESDDEYATHPDIKERIENIQERILLDKVTDTKDFDVLTPAEFAAVVETARMELSFIYLTEKRFIHSIYHTAVLLKKYPDNAYLQENLAYGIYTYAQHRQNDALSYEYLGEDDYFQGEPSRLRHLFQEMTDKENAVFATAHVYEFAKKYPDNEKAQRMARDMTEDLVIYTVEDPDDFFVTVELDTVREFFTRTAFTDYLADETFKKYLADGKKYRKDKEEREEFNSSRAGIAENKKKDKKLKNKGYSLGLKKVVYVNPFYFKGKLNVLGEIEQDYEKSENLQEDLRKHIKDVAAKTKMRTQILDINSLGRSGALEKLKDIRFIENWGDEFYDNPGYVVSLYHNQTAPLIEKYGTSHFAYTGVAGLNNKASGLSEKLGVATVLSYWSFFVFLVPEVSPYFIYRMVRRNNELYYYTSVFDMAGYEKEMEEFNFMKMKDREEVVKTHLHWSMQQMKKKEKKK